MNDCPFCDPAASAVFHDEDPAVFCLWDAYPVSKGHALVVVRRHVAQWFDATRGEQASILEGLEVARVAILERFSPDGFNIGTNSGVAAGQTIPHLHVHVIPRYNGDVADPAGGVRHVIPERGYYLRPPAAAAGSLPPGPVVVGDRVSDNLLSGTDTNPFLGHLLADLARARRVDLAVAFVLDSGLKRVLPYLEEVLERGGSVRILTGDYMDVTEPRALRRLLDLQSLAALGENVQCRVFECDKKVGFHTKAYLIPEHAAYIGSSNLTAHALTKGVEWNYRVDAGRHREDFAAVLSAYEALFTHRRVVDLTDEWIDTYEKRRKVQQAKEPAGVPPEPEEAPPTPHSVQQEALEALAESRANGAGAGLVVLATGLGKTWLSAFDSNAFRRVLFVAHREEILTQARDTYRRIRPDAHLGFYTGQEKQPEADVLFASIQTLSRKQHLGRFKRDAFDYIIVDEFHHAAARTYRRLIDYFRPQFLLGLTATPERTDGGDLLALCGENLVFRCDLLDGIRRELLSPLEYFGVPDDVDYAQIPWRSGRFDPEALDNAVATNRRAENAYEQWRLREGKRTLAFCVSRRHADFMCQYFLGKGVRAVAVHSGESSAPRAQSLERLASGELQVLFGVDMFTEGVDVPAIDTVLMLRPTQSKILWLQQVGRGMRRAAGKAQLRVVDYIGNHKTFLQGAVLLLTGGNDSPAAVAMALGQLERGELELPPGCDVTYDLEAIQILKSLCQVPRTADALRVWYEDFRARHEARPTAIEAWHAGYDPGVVRRTHGSWLEFVSLMGDMSEEQAAVAKEQEEFLRALEKTAMTRSYKMLLLLGMIAEECFPGTIPLDRLAEAFAAQARRSPILRADVGPVLDDPDGLGAMLKKNPIDAWTGSGAGAGGPFFKLIGSRFASVARPEEQAGTELADLTRELCDWRLARYIEGVEAKLGKAPRIPCRLSHNPSGSPIIFLPDRKRMPGIPEGWTTIVADGERYRAKFVKVAVNVAQREGDEANVLPEILRKWFGAAAGQAGEGPHQVLFEYGSGRYEMRPVGTASGEAELWKEYTRADIPGLWGEPFQANLWRQGFVRKGNHMFLLVTLEKQGMQAEHQYADRFLTDELFQWQSQNRTSQSSGVGQLLCHHAAKEMQVHLFIRRRGKTQRGKATPFTYFGDVGFVSWEDDKPITIRWRLDNEVPARLHSEFGISAI